MAKEDLKKSVERIKTQTDYHNLRRIAKESKEKPMSGHSNWEIFKSLFNLRGYALDVHRPAEERINTYLSSADEFVRKGDYRSAIGSLNNAEGLAPEVPPSRGKKYYGAIQKRAERLIKRVESTRAPVPAIAERALLLVESCEAAQKKYARTDGGGVMATIATLGILGGLFFLSTNITGNVIATLNPSTSNIIGACLLVLGIVGAAFFFRRK